MRVICDYRLIFRREPKFRDDYLLSFSPEGIHFRTAHIEVLRAIAR